VGQVTAGLLTVLMSSLVSAGLTLVVLSTASRLRFRRYPDSFRCRVGPPSRRRQKRARWRVRRTHAVWVNDVLLIQSGFLRLRVTPVAARVAPNAAVETLSPFDVRGLGRRPAALRLTSPEGRQLEVAVANQDRSMLVGPFLTACLPGLPRAPRDHGA
jgi:hypothetical protein